MNARPTSASRRLLESERGISLIQIGIAIFVLVGFSAFVLDQGVMYVARGQLQAAADSGALAGAIGWLSDDPLNDPPGAVVDTAISSSVSSAGVFGAGATGLVFTYVCPAGVAAGTKCVRVETYRDGSNGSATLPTYFGNLWGLTSQSARATATAQLMSANWANCLKPWMVADKFTDNNGDGDFDPGTDTYTRPGYVVPDDIGITKTLQAGDPADAPISGEYFRLDLTGGGSSAFLDNISGCANVDPTTTMTTLPGRGPAVDTEVTPLIGTTVPLLLYSPADWATAPNDHGRVTLPIVNILGFKITGVSGRAVTGILAAVAGDIVDGGIGGPTGGFVQKPVLTR